jgi:hypothetical protein
MEEDEMTQYRVRVEFNDGSQFYLPTLSEITSRKEALKLLDRVWQLYPGCLIVELQQRELRPWRLAKKQTALTRNRKRKQKGTTQ